MELLSAFLLDAAIGDPAWLPHPVIQMGRLVRALEKRLRRETASNTAQLVTGAVLVMIVLGTTYVGSKLLLFTFTRFNKYLGLLVIIVLLSTTLAARGLQEAAEKIIKPLRAGELATARYAVGLVVSRDTDELTASEVARAAVETVAENTVDGVTAPLFYALLGGASLALLYKAVNTMDSMLGHKNERYLYFGRAAAKLDDLANFLPARLTVPVMLLAAALLRLDVKAAVIAMRRDSHQHPSPNSGFAEATTAGALNVTLGGENKYYGGFTQRPLLWQEGRLANVDDIVTTTKLMRLTAMIFLAIGLIIKALILMLVRL
ncbi:MAG TPA: adenosylcobinamide-phosphate synthase CbiB [Oscillospiraceae bacterium]|nr:adenosylcobinamide-phosphate synthase CbiB [Oscillospiraceae bacterium]